MSTYIAPVIELKPEPHPNPDATLMKVVKVGGWTVCIRTADWINEDGSIKHPKAAYIEPDTLVPLHREEFKWLISSGLAKEGDLNYRVRAKRLKQCPSFGFLIPVDSNLEVGTNLWEALELERWQPSEPSDNGQSVKAPRRDFAKYDIENIKNYDLFQIGEEVYCFEKIHGCLHADSLIKTENGEVPIKDIKVGDKIYSYNLFTKTFELDIVEKVLCQSPTQLLKWMKLDFENVSIVCTEDHLILTSEGYVEARFLQDNHEVIGFD